MVCSGVSGLGLAGTGRRVGVGPVVFSRGAAGRVWKRVVRQGMVRRGKVGTGRRGKVRHGGARLDAARQAWHDMARRGMAS